MKLKLGVVSLILFSNLLFGQFSQTVNSIIQQTNIDSAMTFVKQLCGESDVYLEKIVRITSRQSYHEGNILAGEYLAKKLGNYGLQIEEQPFQTYGLNILGYQKGNKYPNKKIIVCAHYDNKPDLAPAPGADDNASGTAAVIEIARLLHKIKTDYTILYALWDMEEQGLIGSNYFAKLAAQNKDSIVAVINLDMISYDSNSDYAADIITRSYANSISLAQEMYDLNQTYSIGLKPRIVNPGTTASDHSPFWFNGYSAILLIENGGDFNKYYHQATDAVDKMNITYYSKMIKLSLATVASLAGVEMQTRIATEIPTGFYLHQNYPNPFNSTTRINYQIPADGRVQLKVTDQLGREVYTFVDKIQSKGTYYFQVNMEELKASTGVYFYSLKFNESFEVKKMIFLK